MTGRKLIRFGKRKTSWESNDVGEIRRAEFKRKDGGWDLCASVYDVEFLELTRACAEHVASTLIDPFRTTIGANLDAHGGSVRSTPGSPHFAFIRGRHRELVLDDVRALDDLIARLLAGSHERLYRITRDQVHAYVRGRAEYSDPEWRAFAATNECKTWVKKQMAT